MLINNRQIKMSTSRQKSLKIGQWDQKSSLPIKLTSLQINLVKFTSKYPSNKSFLVTFFKQNGSVGSKNEFINNIDKSTTTS